MLILVLVVLVWFCMWTQAQPVDYDSRDVLSDGLCRYGSSVECCWGWRRTDWGRCQPHCQQGCKHGECVGPDRCKCHPGYTGKACNQDLNECGVKPRPCKHRCMNTLGSYKCFCVDGYTVEPDGNCRNARTCYHANCQYGCEVMKGAVRCTCPSPGLQLGPDRRTCIDVDECVSGGGVCPHRRKCVNTFGSFLCKCHLGFKLTYINGRYTCIDRDSRPFCSLNPSSPKCRCGDSSCKAVLKVTLEPHWRPRTTTPITPSVSAAPPPLTTTTAAASTTTTTTTTATTTAQPTTTNTSLSTSTTTTTTAPIPTTTTTSSTIPTTTTTTSPIPTTTSSTIPPTTTTTTSPIPTTTTTTTISPIPTMTTTTTTTTTSPIATTTTTSPIPTTTTTTTTTSPIPTTATTTTSPIPTTTTTTTTSPIPTTTTTTSPIPTTTTTTTTSPIPTTTTTTSPIPTITTTTTSPIPTTTTTTTTSPIPTTTTTTSPIPTPTTTTMGPTTVNNRINKDVTHRQRGDVHIPRHPENNHVWEFDIELGNTGEDAGDDPEVGGLRCTFDHGLCDWMSDREGDLHWGTAQNPSGGRYLSVPELKAGQRSIRGARLAVQTVPPWSHGNLCFSFSHWLTGHRVGVLQLFVRKKGRDQRYSSSLWSRTGGHGWRHTQVTLTMESVEKVLLKAERRKGRRGQIAVDDVTLRQGACR